MRDPYFDIMLRLYCHEAGVSETTVFILVHKELNRALLEHEHWERGDTPCPLVKMFLRLQTERKS